MFKFFVKNKKNSLKRTTIIVGSDMSIPVIEMFLEEAVILEDLNHANVLHTLAVCIPLTDKPQVVLPYMANGDLKSLIQMENMVSYYVLKIQNANMTDNYGKRHS